MKKVIDYFIITATMENGDRWETRRHTVSGLTSILDDIMKDKEVASFSVEEKYYA